MNITIDITPSFAQLYRCVVAVNGIETYRDAGVCTAWFALYEAAEHLKLRTFIEADQLSLKLV